MSCFIDLNADLGEGFGVYRYGSDEELIPLVSSVNIACGWHGGDPGTIRRAVAIAKKNRVTIGAHPGYPDLMGFGRRYMALAPNEVTDGLLMQIGGLDGLCRAEGTRVSYVKPHGALYNAAAKEEALAEAIVRAILLYDTNLVLLCPVGSAMERAARAANIRSAGEFFADRAYQEDGSLVPRSRENAVLSDPQQIVARVLSAVENGTVLTETGKVIPITFQSVCLHGDNPKAVQLAVSVSGALRSAGIIVRPFAGADNES
ncbi:MAG: LamB/YcsF family protein [Oscillospiraceae bacterium]|nr:LamB/YcsF family protein [Oscillospiraceae bacterium]